MKNARDMKINMIPTAKLYVRLSIVIQDSHLEFNLFRSCYSVTIT